MRKSRLAWIVVAGSLLLLQLQVLELQAAGRGTQVKAIRNDTYGWILTDAQGRSLYLYTKDSVSNTASASNCNGSCTRNWPPQLVEGELTAGAGVNAKLLGTIKRQDGSTQVAYNGWPLYRYARDANPGDIRGQKLGGAFFLVSPQGERVTEEVVKEVHVDEALLAALKSEGARLFATNCAVCHGDQGQGKVGPRLAGNSALGRTQFIVDRILDGFPEHGMPAWRDRLSDREIAAVATFVRNSWSNDFGAVTEEEVKSMR